MKKGNQTMHPCLSCGACCAFFRVSFWAHEMHGTNHPWRVPTELVENPQGVLVSLKGTTRKNRPACYALTGKIGEKASCKIYENRPSPCRDFTASYENGYKNPRCDEARAAHGLRPLNKSDYPERDIPSNQDPYLEGPSLSPSDA